MNVELNQELLDTLRDLKNAVEPILTDAEGEVPEHASTVVTGEDLNYLIGAWGRAVRLVGRIDRPAQYRELPPR